MTPRDPIGHDAPPFANKPEHQGEPRSLIDSTPFLICLGIAIAILYVARAWGYVR